MTKDSKRQQSKDFPKHPAVRGSLNLYLGLFMIALGLSLFYNLKDFNVGNSIRVSLPEATPLVGDGFWFYWPSLFPMIVGLASWFGAWRATRKTTYGLIDGMVSVESNGITKQIPLSQVGEVEVRQGLLQRLVNIGTVIVRSLISTEGALFIEKVRKPKSVKRQIVPTRSRWPQSKT